jgi:hypothetical protein
LLVHPARCKSKHPLSESAKTVSRHRYLQLTPQPAIDKFAPGASPGYTASSAHGIAGAPKVYQITFFRDQDHGINRCTKPPLYLTLLIRLWRL